jgi:hypothetical protein
MLASHYSRAFEYARAAGTQNDELTTRARLALRHAGDRALALRAWPAAASFYAEALELWPRDDPARADVLFRCGAASFEADGSGLELMEQGVDGLEALGDVEEAARAAVQTGRNFWIRGDTARLAEYDARALALVGDRPDSPARAAALTSRAAAANFEGKRRRPSAGLRRRFLPRRASASTSYVPVCSSNVATPAW